jgi:hypothetical protein
MCLRNRGKANLHKAAKALEKPTARHHLGAKGEDVSLAGFEKREVIG